MTHQSASTEEPVVVNLQTVYTRKHEAIIINRANK